LQKTPGYSSSLHPPGPECNPLTISSSDEDNLPHHTSRQTRTKPNKKNEKRRAQFIGSLVASTGIFLMVMVAIASLATSHSANSSKTTITSNQLTTIINSIMSDNNYEELADPKNIIIEGQVTKENIQETIGEDNSTNVLHDTDDTIGNKTVHKDRNEHGMIDTEEKPNNATVVNDILMSKVNTSLSSNIIDKDETSGKDISAPPLVREDVDENAEVENMIDPGDYITA
jgi:hypothetical protein